MGLFDNINSAVENAGHRRQASRHIRTDSEDQENIGMNVLANAAQSVHSGHVSLRLVYSPVLFLLVSSLVAALVGLVN
jgi:hypothetical protein